MAMNGTAHPTALVEADEVGEGTRIWAFAHLLAGAVVGRDCNIGDHCFVENGAAIGNGVTIKNGVAVWEGVILEDGVFVGPQVIFTNDTYPRSPRMPEAAARYATKDWLVRTRVCRGASLGAGSVVRAGVTIGEFALVGAGSVVTRDVPPHGVVAGNPARARGWACVCGVLLSFRDGMADCPTCGRAFEAVTEDGIKEIKGAAS